MAIWHMDIRPYPEPTKIVPRRLLKKARRSPGRPPPRTLSTAGQGRSATRPATTDDRRGNGLIWMNGGSPQPARCRNIRHDTGQQAGGGIAGRQPAQRFNRESRRCPDRSSTVRAGTRQPPAMHGTTALRQNRSGRDSQQTGRPAPGCLTQPASCCSFVYFASASVRLFAPSAL